MCNDCKGRGRAEQVGLTDLYGLHFEAMEQMPDAGMPAAARRSMTVSPECQTSQLPEHVPRAFSIAVFNSTGPTELVEPHNMQRKPAVSAAPPLGCRGLCGRAGLPPSSQVGSDRPAVLGMESSASTGSVIRCFITRIGVPLASHRRTTPSPPAL